MTCPYRHQEEERLIPPAKTKKWNWIFGGLLSTIYASLYYCAATSAEPIAVLFVDGINTFLALSLGDIAGLKNGLIPFPLGFALGVLEWFVIGAYVLPGLWRLVIRLFSRKRRENAEA
ncbi:MAG: hypothetical protein FJ399_02840 [Verrucomicrobia bacterium]|nr:hypothetical protein [Verrucomicrobiota bacterium]